MVQICNLTGKLNDEKSKWKTNICWLDLAINCKHMEGLLAQSLSWADGLKPLLRVEITLKTSLRLFSPT